MPNVRAQSMDPISALVAAIMSGGQPDSGMTDISGDTSDMPPVPQTGPYGAPAVTRDANPLAVASSGGMPGVAAQSALAPPPQDKSPGFLQMLASALAGESPATNSRYDPSTGDFLPLGSYGASSAASAPAAVTPAAYRGPQVAANAGAGNPAPAPAPDEDATTAAYHALHDQAVAHYDQNIAAARAASAAGRDPSVFIKAAGDAAKIAEEISEKSIEYNKPEAQPQTASPGQGILNQDTGKYEVPIPAAPTKADTEAVKLANGQYQVIDKGTGRLVGDPIGQPIDKSSSTLDEPTVDMLAERVLKGDNTALSGLGYGSAGAANRAAVNNRAAAMGAEKGIDASGVIGNQVSLGGQKQEARTSGALGARINTFAEEAKQTGAETLNASDALPRTQWVPINAIEQMGEAAASNPVLSRFQAANNAFANTYAKAVNPSGVPTDESRRAAFAILNVAKSPEAYRAGVQQLQREMQIVQNAVGTIRGQQGGGTAAPSAPMPVGGSTVINGIHIQRVN